MRDGPFDDLLRLLAASARRRSILIASVTGALGRQSSHEMAADARGARAQKRRERRRPGKRVCRRGLRGGLVATFDVVGERFRVWVTNPETIQQILDLQNGTSQANIPVGLLLRGPGRRGHNAPWHWHLDPEEIEMAEAAIELCDAEPSFVEENLRYFVEQVGTYCPWAAELVDVVDCR